MAQVWEATDDVLARRVAVKILHPHLARDESFVRRFRAEAIAAARLAHPSIVSVYDTLAEDGVNAIVMELVSGTTMRADLDQHGPLALNAVLAIGTQVADALGAAHAAGLVHRDVKPANILLSSDGRVLVADFGIAKAAEGADLTSDGGMVGTAKYLAPEQIEGGPIDGRTDLYALGVVLYEALTGEPPFAADTDAGTALARLHRDPTPARTLRPDLPAGVADVVARAMARRPEDRFADAAALRRALLAAGADPAQAPAAAQAAAASAHDLIRHAPPGAPAQPVPPRPVPAPPPAPALVETGWAPRRRRWPWVALVLAIGIGAAAAAPSLLPTDEPAAPVAIAGVADFDPFGDGDRREHPEMLPNVLDDDPETVWTTENYRAADLGAKDGVGLLVTMAEPVTVRSVELTTPEGGWTAEIYVTEGDPPSDLAGWGDPVTTAADIATGATDVTVGARRGKSVLIWFTRLVPNENGTHSAALSSVVVRGS
jgi:serine/threonine-protein kinase